jgi:hypothetical protein
LIDLRQREPSLYKGDYYPVLTDGNTLAYIRRWQGSSAFLMVLNLTGEPQVFKPKNKRLQGKVILSTIYREDHEVFKESGVLKGNEALIVSLDDIP